MNTISIIGCIVGIISCIIGVSTFVSANITRAKEDGVQIAKLDQCVKGIEEIKSSMKEKNHELDEIIQEHSITIAELKTQMITIFKHINKNSDWQLFPDMLKCL